MATYIDMYKRIARTAGLPSTTSNFNDSSDNTALIKELINESNMINSALAPSKPKNNDITLVANQADYVLPSDFGQMRLVNYYQGTRAIEINQTTNDKFLLLQSVVANSTIFVYYTIKRLTDGTTGNVTNNISIYPTPWSSGQIVTTSYLSIATTLNVDPSVATGDSTILTAIAPFDQIDKYYALARIFAQREQMTQAKYYEDLYTTWFEKYRQYMDVKSDDVVVKQGLRTQLNPNLYPTLITS